MASAGSGFGDARDVVALLSNAASLAVVAVSGIAISSILAGRFGVAVVGQFNQLAMIHVVGSQLAAFGVHLSCLHFLSGTSLHRGERASGAHAALIVVVLSGAGAGAALYLIAPMAERAFDSPGLASGIRWIAPAVALFGLNKVLLSLLNSDDRLHAYAALQALRPLIWLIGAGVIAGSGDASPTNLGRLFCIGEVVAVIGGLAVLATEIFVRPDAHSTRAWMRRHFEFGWRAMPSHLIIDFNTRIDVLVLAVFVSDAMVGIYSFAALLAEGVFQVGVLVRTVINRRLVDALVTRDQVALDRIKRSAGSASFALTAIVSLVLVLAYGTAVRLLGLDPALAEGWAPLVIILVGIVACARHSPFWMAVALAGKPAEHTRLMFTLFALNLAVNAAIVPFLNIVGAAIATALMFMAFPVMLRWIARKTLGIRL